VQARVFLNQVMGDDGKGILRVERLSVVKVEDILEIVETDVLSGKAEVFLVEEDLQLHESCVLLPDSLVGLTLHAVDQLGRAEVG